MDLEHLLARRWYGNSVREWLVAAVVFLVALLALLVVRRLLTGRFTAAARRTATEIDDLFVELVRRTRAYFLFVVALELGTRFVTIRPRIDALLDKLVIVVVLLQLGVWATGGVAFWTRRFTARRDAAADAASATTIQAVAVAARAVLWALVFAMGLHAFGFDVSALITGLGIGGVAIALAVQNILGDLFAALAIVLDKPFVIGDSIAVDQLSGTVEHIGLKTTRLRALGGEQLIISNGELLKSRIRNFKRQADRRVAFVTDVDFATPADTVARIPGMLREIIEARSPVRFDRSHFAAYTDAALRFESVYYVLDPDYARYMEIQQTINVELLRRFRAEGIVFAMPGKPMIVKS